MQHKFDNNSLMWTADWADINQATNFCTQFQEGFHKKSKKLSNKIITVNNQNEACDEAGNEGGNAHTHHD